MASSAPKARKYKSAPMLDLPFPSNLEEVIVCFGLSLLISSALLRLGVIEDFFRSTFSHLPFSTIFTGTLFPLWVIVILSSVVPFLSIVIMLVQDGYERIYERAKGFGADEAPAWTASTSASRKIVRQRVEPVLGESRYRIFSSAASSYKGTVGELFALVQSLRPSAMELLTHHFLFPHELTREMLEHINECDAKQIKYYKDQPDARAASCRIEDKIKANKLAAKSPAEKKSPQLNVSVKILPDGTVSFISEAGEYTDSALVIRNKLLSLALWLEAQEK